MLLIFFLQELYYKLLHVFRTLFFLERFNNFTILISLIQLAQLILELRKILEVKFCIISNYHDKSYFRGSQLNTYKHFSHDFNILYVFTYPLLMTIQGLNVVTTNFLEVANIIWTPRAVLRIWTKKLKFSLNLLLI